MGHLGGLGGEQGQGWRLIDNPVSPAPLSYVLPLTSYCSKADSGERKSFTLRVHRASGAVTHTQSPGKISVYCNKSFNGSFTLSAVILCVSTRR